jgi:glycosyltransferase involved in cell wall biosynthesis
LRVLLVGSYGPSLLNFRGQLIASLVARGHEVHVAAPGLQGDLAIRLRALGTTVHDTPLDRQGTGIKTDLKYLKKLKALFRAVSPGLVITYTVKPNIWGALAGARTRVRTAALVTGLGIVFTDTGQPKRLKSAAISAMVRWLYRRASNRNWRIVFQNPDDLADFEAAGCLKDRTKVIMMNGSGIDLTHYKPAPLPEAPNFLMISRILGAKGVREYASAALSVKRTHPHVRFRLVGFYDQGPDAIAEAEIAKWVGGGLEYLGPSDDVRPHLADCRVYVLPSYREGTPRSVLEAMATGRAILTADAPGCRETVVNGENGFLVPVRDVDALAARMRQLIATPELAARMGAASLKIARDKYDVQKVNEALLRDLQLA